MDEQYVEAAILWVAQWEARRMHPSSQRMTLDYIMGKIPQDAAAKEASAIDL